jgi:hypothetical protein
MYGIVTAAAALHLVQGMHTYMRMEHTSVIAVV